MLSLYLTMLETSEERNKFEVLYQLHKRTMLYVAKGVLKDDYLAEDAVHEAFIRVINHFVKIGEPNSPQTRYFLIVIVRNISLTMLEKQKKTVLFEDLEPLGGIQADLEDKVFDTIECQKIVNAMEELPVQFRDVLYLRYVEEYKFSEIAPLLGLNQEIVKKRAQRGQKKLLELLGNKGE